MIPAYPKIFAIGNKAIAELFFDDVVIEEKVDGSQFVFGKINGELYMRSKGKQIFPEAPEKMFREAVDYVLSIENLIEDDTILYCEYLKKPKHNTLAYDNIPKNHLVLFGVSNKHGDFYNPNYISIYAEALDIDCIPQVYYGKVSSAEELLQYLEYTSYLGGQKVEGVVVKNYNRQTWVGGKLFPILAGKYVSEKFKEIHNKGWKKTQGKGPWQCYCDTFRTEAKAFRARNQYPF